MQVMFKGRLTNLKLKCVAVRFFLHAVLPSAPQTQRVKCFRFTVLGFCSSNLVLVFFMLDIAAKCVIYPGFI